MAGVQGIALLGPGLDGQLALELVRRQGCEVLAVTFATPFTHYLESVRSAADRLNVGLTVLQATDDYLHRVAHTRFGYTREMAPCLDCKVAMLQAAAEAMDECGARFLITGDVVGQRLPGQAKRDLALVDFHAGVEGKVVRPLSGKLLQATEPETSGLIRRDGLLDINGKSRQRQLALARQWGWSDIPTVTSGCLLADAAYARRFQDLLTHEGCRGERLPLLAFGRHFRLDQQCVVVIGRNAAENARLAEWHAQLSATTTLLQPVEYIGPTAVLLGEIDQQQIIAAAELLLRYAKKLSLGLAYDVEVTTNKVNSTIRVVFQSAGDQRTPL